MWNTSDDSRILAPQVRAVLLMENDIISGLGDQIQLSDPDGVLVQTAQWNIVSDCQTMGPGETETDGWELLLWPTPGAEEPDESLLQKHKTSSSVALCRKVRLTFQAIPNSSKLPTLVTALLT